MSEIASSAIDLELLGVRKNFGDTVVVRDTSFSLEKGEFLSLLGPSGCGKTTTLAMIAGFERPNAGAISIRGKRVEDLPPERRDIGMVFQNYALFPHMNVATNIGFGLKMRRVSAPDIRERVALAAELVKVSHLHDRYPNELSGGQQQRVALARALVVQPAILLLDEPFGALDRQLREDLQIEVRALLRRLNITTVFVTHDQDEALSMSDRVAVMNEGRIEQIAAPKELYNSPATRFAASFIGKGTFIPGVIKDASGKIETPLGLFGSSGKAALPVGTKVDYFLRPESIALAGDHVEGNRIAAQVVAVTFLGDRQLIIAEASGGFRFTTRLSASQLMPQPGQQIALEWPDSEALVFASS